MGADARLFEGWCVPAWDATAPATDVATRVLPPARTRAQEPPDTALAVPELGGRHVAELADTLRAARHALLARPVREIARAVGRVASRFLDPGDPLRAETLAALPGTTGLSPAMCEAVLDGMARDWTAERLEGLLAADFRDPDALDRFVPTERPETGAGRGHRLRVLGHGFAFHLCAGSVPGVSATSLVRSLLVKTPVLLKPGRGDVALPVFLLRALANEDEDLARAAAVVYWPGGDPAWAPAEDAALERADLVVAYGGDSVIGELRGRLPEATPLVAYHHRIGFAMVGRDAVGTDDAGAAAGSLARAVALFDQRGCVSPHVAFVEGDDAAVRGFAASVADALERLDRTLPAGRVTDAEASDLQQLRGTAEMRSAGGEAVWVRAGGASPWTVLVEPGGELVPSCLNRVLRIVAVPRLEDVPELVEPVGRHLQTVGHAGVDGERLEALAEALARAGASRVVDLDEVPFPPAWWRHDGRGPLRALVREVELV